MKTISVPVIENDHDLDEALSRIEKLMDDPDADGHTDEVRLLGTVIQSYEDEHYPIGYPGPVGAINFYMDQNGYSNKDLAELLGGQPRVSNIMSGKRQLSIAMIRKLHEAWKIPYDLLIEPASEPTVDAAA